jgi:hypothetical protein
MKRRGFLVLGLAFLGFLIALFSIKLTLAQTSSSQANIAANKSNLQIVRETVNLTSTKNNSTFEVGDNVHAILSIYSPSVAFNNITITDYLSNEKVDSVRNAKLTLSDGTSSNISFTAGNDMSVNFVIPQILQGKNTIEYDYQVAN